MERIEIILFDLDSDNFVEPNAEQFWKENPKWNAMDVVFNLKKHIEQFLKINGIKKRILQADYEIDQKRITIKYQDIHESIYKRY